MSSGYIYALQTREFLNLNSNIVKIGRTQDIIQRFKSYAKGSRLLCTIYVEDCIQKERILIKELKLLFKQRKDIGTEYFEGCISDIVDIVTSLNGTSRGDNKQELRDQRIDIKQSTNRRPYVCVRCGFNSVKKSNIYTHLYNRQKPCISLESDIELTDKIKEHIMRNRIYQVKF